MSSWIRPTSFLLFLSLLNQALFPPSRPFTAVIASRYARLQDLQGQSRCPRSGTDYFTHWTPYYVFFFTAVGIHCVCMGTPAPSKVVIKIAYTCPLFFFVFATKVINFWRNASRVGFAGWMMCSRKADVGALAGQERV